MGASASGSRAGSPMIVVREIALGNVDQHALAQLDALEVRAIGAQGLLRSRSRPPHSRKTPAAPCGGRAAASPRCRWLCARLFVPSFSFDQHTRLAKEPTVPGGTQASLRALSVRDGSIEEDKMGIPNDSVTQNEIEEKRRQEAKEEYKEEQRRKAEKSLDRGLEDSFPASDPPNVTQPPPTRSRQETGTIAISILVSIWRTTRKPGPLDQPSGFVYHCFRNPMIFAACALEPGALFIERDICRGGRAKAWFANISVPTAFAAVRTGQLRRSSPSRSGKLPGSTFVAATIATACSSVRIPGCQAI